MNDAVIALAGVVVGALASGIATYLIDRAAQRHNLMLQRRASARLIEDELKRGLDTFALIHAALEEQIESERAAAGDVERHLEAIKRRSEPSKLLRYQLDHDYLSEPTDDAWREQQHHLAEALSDADWRSLALAHTAMTEGRLVAVAKSLLEGGSFQQDPPVLAVAKLNTAIERLQNGLKIVATLSREGGS